MLAVPGGRYRLRLVLSQAVGNDLSWLVAAIRAQYGGTEVESAARQRGGRAAIIVRTSRRTTIDPGDIITSPVTEGLTTTGLEMPEATVEQIEPISLPTTLMTREGDLLAEPAPTPWTGVDAAKLALSAVLIGGTAWLISRIEVPAA